jgi:AsmA protein
VIQSTRGAARVDVTQGTVKGLALVRTIVVASSMRADAAAGGGGDEAFSRLGASFTLGDGVARTNDLTFESNDVSLDGAGQIGLDGTNIDLSGRVRLSEALTRQAGRDLVRYTQEGGRVTVPVTISGSAGALSVRLETADVLKRAITNKAVEEAGDALRRGIGGLFNR